MSNLVLKTKTESFVKEGIVEGANVTLTITRDSERGVQQIIVNATKSSNANDNMHQGVNIYMDCQPVNRSININMYGCDLNDAPIDLIQSLLEEMKSVPS